MRHTIAIRTRGPPDPSPAPFPHIPSPSAPRARRPVADTIPHSSVHHHFLAKTCPGTSAPPPRHRPGSTIPTTHTPAHKPIPDTIPPQHRRQRPALADPGTCMAKLRAPLPHGMVVRTTARRPFRTPVRAAVRSPRSETVHPALADPPGTLAAPFPHDINVRTPRPSPVPFSTAMPSAPRARGPFRTEAGEQHPL